MTKARGAALLLAATLSLLSVFRRSIATDEAFTWGIVSVPTSDLGEALSFTSGNMLPYFSLQRLVVQVSDGPIALRLVSVVAFLATVLVLSRATERWFGGRASLITTFLTATSVPLVYYSAEARSYAVVALSVTMMWLAAERMINDPTRRNGALLAIAVFIASSSHLVVMLTLPFVALALGFLPRWRGVTETIKLSLPLGIGAVPVVALVAAGEGSQTDWIPGLGPGTIARAGRILLGDHAQYTREYSGFLISALYVVSLAILGYVLFSFKDKLQTHHHLLLLWLVSGPISLTAISVVNPLLWHRYLIGTLPAMLVLLGWAFSKVDPKIYKTVPLALVVLGAIRLVALSPHSADEYEAVADAIEARADPSDAFVVTTAWVRVGFDYYWRDEAPVVADPAFGPVVDHGADYKPAVISPTTDKVFAVGRAFAAQVWDDTQHPDSEYDFGEVDEDLGSSWEVAEEFDVQRFRVRVYERAN